MVTPLRTRLSRAGARQRRCFSLREGARSVVGLAGRSQAGGLPSSRCPSVRGHTWSRSAHLAGRSQAGGLPSSRCPSVRGHTWSRSAQPNQRTPSQPTRARPTAVSRITSRPVAQRNCWRCRAVPGCAARLTLSAHRQPRRWRCHHCKKAAASSPRVLVAAPPPSCWWRWHCVKSR